MTQDSPLHYDEMERIEAQRHPIISEDSFRRSIMPSLTFRIDNMHCGACVQRVTQALTKVHGIEIDEVRVGAARVNAQPEDTAAIVTSLHKAGYPAHLEAE